MKAKLLILTIISSICALVYAQAPVQPVNPPSPVTPWVSNTSTEKVTIDNGTGAKLSIMISVDRRSEDSPGINVDNCGKTTHIDAGSSGICVTVDPRHPVTFTSDNDRPATGSYQITQLSPK